MPTVNSVDAANFPNCNRPFGVFSMCANENKDRQKERTRKKGTSVFFGHFPPLRLSAAAADADAVLLTTSAWCFYCLYCARSFCHFFRLLSRLHLHVPLLTTYSLHSRGCLLYELAVAVHSYHTDGMTQSPRHTLPQLCYDGDKFRALAI